MLIEYVCVRMECVRMVLWCMHMDLHVRECFSMCEWRMDVCVEVERECAWFYSIRE